MSSERNEIVVVLGMGRSGTALTCQVLEAAGVGFGRPEYLVGPSQWNPKGHYDAAAIHALNIEILEKAFDVSWLWLGELPWGWEDWPSMKRYHDGAVAVLRDELKHAREHSEIGLLGIKDPRITRMRPFWEKVFAEVGLKPRYILCWRHPVHVYLSCHPGTIRTQAAERKPGQFEMVENFHASTSPVAYREDMFAIWATYMMDGLNAKPEAVIYYDNWFLRGHCEKQAEMLSRIAGGKALSREDLDKIIDPELRHYAVA